MISDDLHAAGIKNPEPITEQKWGNNPHPDTWEWFTIFMAILSICFAIWRVL